MGKAALRAPELIDTASPGMRKPARHSSAPPSLVEMDEVLLDGDELQKMVRTLTKHATNVVCRVKRSADALVHEPVLLAELAPLLLKENVFGAQVQYSYKSGRWLDTLVVTGQGIRVVRMQMS